MTPVHRLWKGGGAWQWSTARPLHPSILFCTSELMQLVTVSPQSTCKDAIQPLQGFHWWGQICPTPQVAGLAHWAICHKLKAHVKTTGCSEAWTHSQTSPECLHARPTPPDPPNEDLSSIPKFQAVQSCRVSGGVCSFSHSRYGRIAMFYRHCNVDTRQLQCGWQTRAAIASLFCSRRRLRILSPDSSNPRAASSMAIHCDVFAFTACYCLLLLFTLSTIWHLLGNVAANRLVAKMRNRDWAARRAWLVHLRHLLCIVCLC